MTTINSTISALEDIRDQLFANRAHTDQEAGALLRAFDDAVKDFTDRMGALRTAIVASYKGQLEADRLMVEGERATPELQIAAE